MLTNRSLRSRLSALWPGSSSQSAYWQELVKSLVSLAWFVEARDPYTGGHLWRVSRYSRLLAQAEGLADADIARAELGGFLHDLGKVGIPDGVLTKPGPLTDEEFEVIKTHPNQGARLLAGNPVGAIVRPAILMHHERPDGNGYPEGLHGARIPWIAQLIAVADAFDAMTSERPYRSGMPIPEALERITTGRGTQFAPRWVDPLLALAETGELEHIQGHSDDGIPLQECPMCGPTLVVMSHHRSADSIYCRNCGGEFLVLRESGGIEAVPTGQRGTAKQLEPEADETLIEEVVQRAVEKIPWDEDWAARD